MKNGNKRPSRQETNSKPQGPTLSDQEEQHLDNVVIATINGLDMFIAQASSAGVGTVARILHNAKSDLVYWAAHMNFYETAQEKFINRVLYNNAMFAAADFITKFSNVKDKKKLHNELEKGEMAMQSNAAVGNLRKALPA